MFQRPHYQVLKKRIAEPRRFIQVLFGPRQIGKTTLINQLLQASQLPSFFVSADAVAADDKSWVEQQWNTARLRMLGEGVSEFFINILYSIISTTS